MPVPRPFTRPTAVATLGLAVTLLAGLLGGCAPRSEGTVAAAGPTQAASAGGAPAPAGDDKAIRQALAERLKQLPPIDEVRTTVIPGLYEVRFGQSQILYTDVSARYIIEGALIDVQTMTNLTEARLDALTAVRFDELPLKDALVYRQGDGSRKLAVFGDPNCGYCKRFERDLMALPNVTIYTFVMPILGADSVVKSRNIWCAADPAQAWRDWMLQGKAAPEAGASCDASALVRNAEFGRKHRIQATPGMVLADGSRKSGAVPLPQLEALLAAVAAKKS
jgi:thiol:disulfide interchange protein DsbC